MWDYRVFRKKEKVKKSSKEFVFYSVYEVYYDEDGEVETISEEPVQIYGDTLLDLLCSIKKLLMAFTKPILDWNVIDKEISKADSREIYITHSVFDIFEVETSKSLDPRKHEEYLQKKRSESEELHDKVLLNAPQKVVLDFIANLPDEKRIH